MLTLMLLAAAAVSPADGKTMAVDDWHAMTILGVGASDDSGAPLYLRVAAGDLDGDGRADEAIVKLVCTGGAVTNAFYNVKSPRDSASGMASGKRTHKPVTFVKEWGAATPQLLAMKPTYDVKMAKGARVAADAAGWTAITLGATDGLCAAASAAVVKTKTKSNQSND